MTKQQPTKTIPTDDAKANHPLSLTEPWSAQHKKLTKFGSLPYSLSNSFSETVTLPELLDYCRQRGDNALIHEYQEAHSLAYTPNGGSLDLRTEISKLYGPQITAEHILVFAGAQVAVQTAAWAVLGKYEHELQAESKDGASPICPHSIVFTPGYQSLVEGPKHAGSQVTAIPLRPETSWDIDIDQVAKAIRTNTKYIVMNQPYNPAGTLISPQTQQALIDLASKHDIVILCDEVYRLLEHDPEKRIAAMADAYPQGMSLVTLSKPWGACGVTIGWIAMQSVEIKQRLWNCQYFGTACPSRASELQGIMVLRASSQLLERNMKIIRANMVVLDAFFAQHGEWFSWIRPTAGAIAAVKFLGPMTSAELGQALAAFGIGMKPSYCFSGSNVTPDIDYFRIGYGEHTMPAAISKLGEFVEKHQDEWRRQLQTSTP